MIVSHVNFINHIHFSKGREELLHTKHLRVNYFIFEAESCTWSPINFFFLLKSRCSASIQSEESCPTVFFRWAGDIWPLGRPLSLNLLPQILVQFLLPFP